MRFRGLVVSTLVILVIAGQCLALDFSADTVVRDAQGRKFTGKFYRSGKKTRDEIVNRGQTLVKIARADKHVLWSLLPSRMIYTEKTVKGQTSGNAKKMILASGFKSAGKERVNGYTCSKFTSVRRGKSTASDTVWYSDKLDYVLRWEIKTGSKVTRIEYRNIREGKPDSSLFEIPTGYKKVPLPKPAVKPGKPAKHK